MSEVPLCSSASDSHAAVADVGAGRVLWFDGGPRRVAVSYERGTPVQGCLEIKDTHRP